MIKLFKELFTNGNRDNNPPCIVCEHCTRAYESYGRYIRMCKLVTSKDGVYYELCYRARKSQYCKYNSKE